MSLITFVAAALARGGAALKLSGETISNSETNPTQGRAHVIFNSDGTVDKREGGTVSQIDSGTDWIIPNSSADSIYEVRFTGLTGDAFDVNAAAADTWIDLSANRTWGYTRGTVGTNTGSATFEIRIGSSGSAQTSASYTLTATQT